MSFSLTPPATSRRGAVALPDVNGAMQSAARCTVRSQPGILLGYPSTTPPCLMGETPSAPSLRHWEPMLRDVRGSRGQALAAPWVVADPYAMSWIYPRRATIRAALAARLGGNGQNAHPRSHDYYLTLNATTGEAGCYWTISTCSHPTTIRRTLLAAAPAGSGKNANGGDEGFIEMVTHIFDLQVARGTAGTASPVDVGHLPRHDVETLFWGLF